MVKTRRRWIHGTLLLISCLALISCTRMTASQQSAPNKAGETGAPDEPRKLLREAIVYTSLSPPNWDIFMFEGRDAEPRRLTESLARDYNAVFSPDGRWIVFTSERGGNADLFALDLAADGRPVALTRSEAMDDAASFSPDGRQLVFVSTRDGDADIFVMAFAPEDEGAEQRAVNITKRAGGDFNPAYSPDGKAIAYSRQDELWETGELEAGRLGSAGTDVYTIEVDGSNPRRLSEPGSISGSPAWSADGSEIYYYRIAVDHVELRRAARDGSSDASLGPFGLSPAVMPDGRIACSVPQPQPGMDEMDMLRTGRIFSCAPDGTDLRPESNATTSWFAPDFDRQTGRMVVHGAGPVGDLPVMDGDFVFAPPDGHGRVALPDRTIEVRGIRGYFPALTPDGDVLSTVLPFQETMPLHISAPNGAGSRALFTPVSGMAWGAGVASRTGVAVVAVGPPFADGSARVDIWTLRLDGSDAVNLTGDVEENDALPHISADGRRIVFRRGGDHSGRVFIMDADGTNRRRLTKRDALETMPALSSDGEWVVFPTMRGAAWKLWIQRIDGSDGRFLEADRLDIPDVSMHPRFSPDDKWIVFTSNRSFLNDEWTLTWFPQPYGDMWAIPVTGGRAVRLTHNTWEDGPCDWGAVRLECR
jgi:Tol biopolymer transport system component